MQAESREGLATVKQAAGYLGVSQAKLYAMMSRGELAYVKLGKSRRVRWQSLEELVQRNTVNGTVGEPLGN